MTRVLTAAAILAAVLATPSASHAQRPYQGLFANWGGPMDHSLMVSGSLGSGWNSSAVAGAPSGLSGGQLSDLSTALRGGVTQSAGSLNYAMNRDRFSIGATGATSVYYHPSGPSRFIRRYHVGASTSAQLTRDLSARIGASYVPYSLSTFYESTTTTGPDLGGLPDLDLGSSRAHHLSYSAGTDYNRQLSRRVSLNLNYDFNIRQASDFAPRSHRHAVGTALSYEIGRGLGVHAGYRYMQSEYGGISTPRTQYIDAGVSYDRPLSISRRTTLSFGTGSAVTSSPESANRGTHYHLTGNAQLTHEMGRTWSASLAYRRSVNPNLGWSNIVMSDSVSGNLSGLLGRRVNVQAGIHTSTGSVGLNQSDSGFDSWYGSASLGYALGRYTSLSLSYGYYNHRFERGVALPSDFTNRFDRHSVRVSVGLWAPLYQRPRR